MTKSDSTGVTKSSAVGNVPPVKIGETPISSKLAKMSKKARKEYIKKYLKDIKTKEEKNKNDEEEKANKLMALINFFSKKKVNEELQYIKFRYKAKNINDPRPKVKVLDFEYPGRRGQKTYGKRKDVLGFNVNYVSNKKEAIRNIDDLADFGKLLKISKKDLWERFKAFYPEVAKVVIRRYKRDNIKRLKHKKDNNRWKRGVYSRLVKLDNEEF